MKCIKFKLLLPILLMLLATKGAAFSVEPDKVLQLPTPDETCEGVKWCDWIAVKKNWPQARSSKSLLKISNELFEVSIPQGFNYQHIYGGLPSYSLLYDDFRIGISVKQTPEPIAGKHADLIKSAKEKQGKNQLVPVDLFKIAYLNTKKIKEPKNLYQKTIWRLAFLYKASEQLISVPEYYTIDNISAYMMEVKRGKVKYRVTIVTTINEQNKYLKIIDDGAPKQLVLDILSSVRLVSNQHRYAFKKHKSILLNGFSCCDV
ncbi:hypothetical protein [Zooshikella harenae]|uniref:Uncharacterized protein n=1 Tax=Zooshikella harenae TaxID=2827238 RepID=A0ABS5Z689_9GAMM|nr:hypothetical protein [Zooshikella harenae]MBU2709525.1 hypothetical protein [Zooshikella harenae]